MHTEAHASRRSRRLKRATDSFFNLATLARWQLSQVWKLFLLVALGMIASVLLVGSVPLLTRVNLTANARSVFASKTLDTSSQVSFSLSTLDSSDMQSMLQQLQQDYKQYGQPFFALPPEAALHLDNSPIYLPNSIRPLPLNGLYVHGYDPGQVAPHLKLLRGRLPRAASNELEVALTQDNATHLAAHLGSTYIVNVALTRRDTNQTTQVPVTIKVVGIFQNLSSTDESGPYADVILALLALLTYGLYTYLVSLNVLDAQTQVVLAGPCMLAIATLLCLSGGLAFLRLFPILVRLGASVTRSINPENMSALPIIATDPGSFGRAINWPAVDRQANVQAILAHLADQRATMLRATPDSGVALPALPALVSAATANEMHLTIGKPFLLQDSSYDAPILFVDADEALYLPGIDNIGEDRGILVDYTSFAADFSSANFDETINPTNVWIRTQPGASSLTQVLPALEHGQLTLSDLIETPARKPCVFRPGMNGRSSLGKGGGREKLDKGAIFWKIRSSGESGRGEAWPRRAKPQRFWWNCPWSWMREPLSGCARIWKQLANCRMPSSPRGYAACARCALILPGKLPAISLVRLFPLLLRLGARQTGRAQGVERMLALAQMARAPRQRMRIALLLLLTTAFVVFVVGFAASQNQHLSDLAQDWAGADFSGTPGYNLSEADLNAYTCVPGVTSVTAGYTSMLGTDENAVNVLAVDPANFIYAYRHLARLEYGPEKHAGR